MNGSKSLSTSEIRVLFRYRDLVARTLEEHQKIIETGQPCWWGWWKRPNEPNRDEIWDYLQSEIAAHGQVIVGLFDSGASDERRAVHRARVCAVISPLPQGDPRGVPPLPSGEDDLVPSYYRESPFSRAWLKISEIEDQAMPFFGEYSYSVEPPLPGIPKEFLARLVNKIVTDKEELRLMDTTIWQVRLKQPHDHGEKFLAPSIRLTDPVSPEPIRIKGDTILHLSDVHFAEGPRFRKEHVWWYPGDIPKSASLAEVVSRAIKDSSVGMVIISGDFTFAADEQEFDEAYKSINALLGTLGLGPDHLIIVPGNHDIAWSLPKGKKYDPRAPVQSAPDVAKRAYSAFYRRLMKHDANDDFAMGRRFLFPHGIVVEVCALNSSSLEQGRNYLAGMGMVRPNVFDDVRTQLGWSDPEGSFSLRILVLHHHLTATEDVEDPAEFTKGFGMAIDAKRILRDAARYGVHLVLHGHRHRVFIWREGVYQLPDQTQPQWRLGDVSILGGGSAGSSSVEAGHNYFNLVSISSERVLAKVYRSSKGGAFQPMGEWKANLAMRGDRLMLEDWQDPRV
jgi:hypothetical protein